LVKKLSLRFFAVLLVVGLLSLSAVAVVSAAPGGTPAKHGVDGKTFGDLVSGMATSGPGAVAAHVSNAGGNAGGVPAKHGLIGMEFGAAVSALAKMYPGAVADHVN
jgi:hypothetical protein